MQMIDNIEQLKTFRNEIAKVINKFVKKQYDYEWCGEEIEQKIMSHFPDEMSLFETDKLCATHEFLFNEFNEPQQLLMIFDKDLVTSQRYYCDAFIRIMVKDKKIWIENWIASDEDEDCYEFDQATISGRNKMYKNNKPKSYDVRVSKFYY